MNQYDKDFDELIPQIVQDEYTHYRFLSALSYLEHIGSRKIMKAIPYEELNPEIVHHMSEEVQHSLMLKQVAEREFDDCKLGQRDKNKIYQICENYFQRLDQGIKDHIQSLSGSYSPMQSYLWVSHIIEIRAMKVYPRYVEALSDGPLKSVIQKITKDEVEHLHMMKRIIQTLPKVPGLVESDMIALESQLFTEFLQDFEGYFMTPIDNIVYLNRGFESRILHLQK